MTATHSRISLPHYDAAEHIPPPEQYPTLRLVARYAPPWKVRPPLATPVVYRAYLSTALARALNLSDYDPIELRPPASHHSWWHIDVRKQARNRVRWYKSTRPRIEDIHLPPDALKGADFLILRLVPGQAANPDYHPMLPDAYFAPR